MTTSYLTSIRRHLAPLALTACLLSVGMISVPSAATADETASVGTIATGAFHHPGVLVNRAQLDFIKSKVAEGAEPWKSAFEAAKASDLGALDYTPKPRDEVCCGPRSNPDLGCKDEQHDSEAAYTQALLWYFSGNRDLRRERHQDHERLVGHAYRRSQIPTARSRPPGAARFGRGRRKSSATRMPAGARRTSPSFKTC